MESLANGLTRRGHAVTGFTAGWGFESRVASGKNVGSTRCSAFGWMNEVNGVRSVYLPTWFRYRAATWNPAITRFCRERLGDFDVVHIFGLYDLLGLAVARECRKRKIPYLIEPIGMFVPIVRSIFLKRVYHAQWGKGMLGGAAGLIATAEQEVEELAAGGIPRTKVGLRRNAVMAQPQFPERGGCRDERGIPAEARLSLLL